MSKRPETGNAAISRPRRPGGRLRDMPIWSKLGLIMLVPTLATIIVGVSGLVDHINGANNADRARTLALLSQSAAGLVDQLQAERAYGVIIATTDLTSPEHVKAQDAYKSQWLKVDQAKQVYAQQRTTLDTVPDRVNSTLSRLDRNIADLPATRSQAFGARLEPNDVEQAYGDVITDLLAIRDTAAQLSTDTTLSDHMRTVSALAQAKEYISQQRDVGYEIVQEQNLSAPLRTKFMLTQTGYDISVKTLQSVASANDEQLFERVVAGPDKNAATNLTEPLMSLQGANTGNIPFNRAQWDTAMSGYNALFRNVETQLDRNIVTEATSLRNSVNQRVFLETSVLLGLLLLAILFAWLVARSMARSLRELRQGALSVAQFGLPHAVSRLRDPSLHQSLTPAQVADQVAEPLPVRSRDEFGQVTEAFNAVHLEAVRTAAEQAALRSSVATMFVNLARRSQILVDRLIGHLDRLERGEEDPDRLAELFQLDHLATRMRRNDENLLVLAGADSTRVQREPAALIDVLRAAQSEVEHYTRIEFGMVDRDVEVAAHAVNDMVHLVAELFDNATAFSPPNSTVLVEARRFGDGAILSVEDRGIGISREQLRDLNERLANPPMVDVAVSRMMGLVVVARLANRHEVRVELRPADTERGTVAEVVLPPSALVGAATATRLQPGESAFGAVEQGAPARPQFAEPLALESGRSGPISPAGRPFDPNPPMPSGGMLGTGRMPSWSDLTGASSSGFGVMNGTNGANGFRTPRDNEPVSGPPTYNGGELPRRVTDADTGYGATIPRQLPANPESQNRPPFVPPVSAPPVPSTPPEMSASEPPAAAPPPAWPPVAADRDHAAPHVPESLAAALDMTAELPRYRPSGNGHGNGAQSTGATPDGSQTPAQRAAAAHEAAAAQAAEAHAAAAAQIAAAEAAAQQRAAGNTDQRYADETMELPIFRELESAWFMTARPQPESGPPPGVPDDRVTAQRFPTGEPAPRVSGVPQQPGSRDDSGDEDFRDRDAATVGAVSAGAATTSPWHTAADEGWQAARAAAEAPIESTTTAGLPKRTPMAQLVPGGVDRGGQSVQRRTPEAVRGLLSAYHRGVQRGRQSTNPEATPGAQQSSQAGKEHEA